MAQTDTFLRHRGPITCAAHIANSNKIITSGYDSAVALFNMKTNDVELLGYHEHLVNRVTVNQAGTLAATASSDYNLYIWDLTQNKLALVLKGHDDDVEDFVFINDTLGASVSRDWRIIIWDLSNGAIKRIILGHDKDVLSINYLDGKLYTSGDDMTLRVWALETGKQLAKIGPFETETDSCAIDPLNQRVILGCDDGLVRVFDINTHQLIAELSGHQSAIKKVAVSPYNGDILSAAYDQKILIWDHSSFTQKQQLASHSTLWERSFNWSPDGQSVVAGTFDGTVLVWNADSGVCTAELGSISNGSDRQGNACFNEVASHGNDEVTLVSDDGYVRTALFNADQAQWQQVKEPDSGRVLMNAVTYCPTHQRVITGAHNQNLYFFDYKQRQLDTESQLELNEGPINCIRSSELDEHKGQLFIACYSGTIAHVSENGQLLNKISAHDNAVKALRLHPTRSIGVSCCAEGSLVSWNYDGKKIREYAGHTAIIDDVDIDPTGHFIASAGRDFTLKIHGIDDGVLYHNIHLGRRSPKSLSFVSADVVIVTNYWGELLRISLNDGSIIRQTIAKNGISSITKHGDNFAVSSYDGAVYLVEHQDLSVVNSLHSMQQRVQESAFA